MRKHWAFILVFAAAAMPVFAGEVSFPARQASVLVVCGTHRGSGAFTDVERGYVVTVGHLVIDPDTGERQTCQVQVVDESFKPKTAYDASVVRAVYDTRRDLDFAVLHLGERVAGPPLLPPASIPSNEFAGKGDAISIVGFPGNADTTQVVTDGTIMEFDRGLVVTGAAISQGSSGSPALDASGRLVGVASRISVVTDPTTRTEKIIDYQLGDVLALVGWLDRDGSPGHDEYLHHADPARFDGAAYIIRDEDPGCRNVVRTEASSTVYCLLSDSRRFVFPNAGTFHSWYPDFSTVGFVPLGVIAQYRLGSNMTYKAGTLIKVQTDPRVFLVVDSIGTVRWIPSEQRAADLFGADWATKVKDVPDAFFTDYRLGSSIP